MPQCPYINTDDLERSWFEWIVASSVPELERFRQSQRLWTKTVMVDCGGGKMRGDPYHPNREHILKAGANLLHFNSSKMGALNPAETVSSSSLPPEWLLEAELKYVDSIDEDSVVALGYFREEPTAQLWSRLNSMVWLICDRISWKFNHIDREDIVNEVYLQIGRKIQTGKLRYKPGLAPVFNLLTTAIHNCYYSLLLRESRQISHKNKLAVELTNGTIPPLYRSLAVASP